MKYRFQIFLSIISFLGVALFVLEATLGLPAA